MTKYYYLASALPQISLKSKPDMSFEELKFMLNINLNERDRKKMALFQMFIDINNLKQIWMNQEIDTRGNFNLAELEDVILIKDVLPDFVFEFLDKYEKNEDRLRYFSFLISSFFKKVIFESSGFLKFYFKLERDLRLILTALRAKKLRRDISHELQFEDLYDDLVAYILAQKDMENFDPPKDFDVVKNIYIKNMNNPKKLHIKILEYKSKKINEFLESKPFTMDQILSYVALFIIVEDFYKLSAEEGKEKVEKL